MGCCALYQTEPRTHTPSLSLHLPTDQYALELEHYATELLQTAPWLVLTEGPLVTISYLPHSRYSNKAPVFSLRLKPLPAIDLDYGVKMLIDPELRPQWDFQLSQYRVVPTSGRQVYYTRYEFPFPFRHRDLLEATSVLPKPSSASVIKYSTAECEVSTGLERAVMVFFVAALRVVEDCLEVVVTVQLDLHLPFIQVLQTQVAGVIEDWVEALADFVVSSAEKHPYVR